MGFGGGEEDIEEERHAQPGATDNLGYAQRIREGFSFRSSEAGCLSFIVGQGMKTEEMRQRVVALFSENRAHPNEAFDEDHFIDFFIRNPTGKKWATQGSFTGLRRRNRFFRQIEREFCVCLGNKDFERSFSLSDFVDRIVELRSSPRSSRAALKARRRAGAGWGAVVVIDFVLLSVAMWLRDFWWLSALPLVAFAVFTYWASEGLIADSIHNRALYRMLESDYRTADRVKREAKKAAQPGATDNPDDAQR